MLGLGLKLYEIVFLLERNDVERILITQRYHYRPYNIRKIKNLITSAGGVMVRHPVPSHHCLYQTKLHPKKRLFSNRFKDETVTTKRTEDLRQLATWSHKRKGCYAPEKKKKSLKLSPLEKSAMKRANRFVRLAQKRSLKRASDKLYGFKLKTLYKDLHAQTALRKQFSPLDRSIDYKRYLNQPRYKLSLVTQYRKFYAKKECQYLEMIKPRVPMSATTETKASAYLRNGLHYPAVRKTAWKGRKITKWAKYWFNWRVMSPVTDPGTFFPRTPVSTSRYKLGTDKRNNDTRVSRLIKEQLAGSSQQPSSFRKKIHLLRSTLSSQSLNVAESIEAERQQPRLTSPELSSLTRGWRSRQQRLLPAVLRQVPTTGHKSKAYVKKIFPRNTSTKAYKMIYTHPIKKLQIPSQFRKLPEWWLRPSLRHWFKWGVRGLWIPLKLRFARYKGNLITKLKKKSKWKSFKTRQSSSGHNESPHISQFKRKILWKKYPYQPLMTLRYWGNGELSQRVNSEIQIDVKRNAIAQGFILSIY